MPDAQDKADMLIMLETNLLHGRADPDAANEIKPLLTLAAKVSAPLNIPEPCLIELRDGHRGNVQEAIAELEKARCQMSRMRINVTISPIDEAAELAGYEERLQRFLKSHAITTIPFVDTLPSPRALFEAAVKKQSPFDSTGNNLRDAIICLSISQFARTEKAPVLVVTNDGDFRVVLNGQEGIQALDLSNAIKTLDAQLSDKDRARRADLSGRIATALRKEFDKISQIAGQQVDFSVAKWMEVGIRLITINKFEGSEVRNVEPAESSATTVPFTAEVGGKLHCTAEDIFPASKWTISAQAPTKVGQSTSFAESFASDYAPYLLPNAAFKIVREPRVVLFEVWLSLEGDATLDAQGNVEKVSYTRIYEKRPKYKLIFGVRT